MPYLKDIILALILMAPLVLEVRALAQTPPSPEEPPTPARVMLNTTLNIETGAIVLDDVVIYEGSTVRQLAYQDLWKPELITYQNAGSSTVLYVHPIPLDTANLGATADIGNPATDSVRQTAKDYLTDAIVNSAFSDIADGIHGLTLRFDPPLVNDPGVDLLIGEMSAPIGAADPYCPNTFSTGGDALTLQLDGGASLTIEPDAYRPQGPLGVIRLYGHEELGEGTLLASVADLENYPTLEGRVIDHLHLYTTMVDLNRLGIEEGESISQIVVASAPVEMTVDGEILRCLIADPVFIFGL